MGNDARIETSAIKVSQRPLWLKDEIGFIKECDFFVFSLSSTELLKIAEFQGRRESPVGVQRDHKKERDKEIGGFIASEHPFFPNTIIINIPLEFKDIYYDEIKKVLKVNIPEKKAYVIDGQHRLKAFASEYSKQVELDMVVSAYFGLELPTIAEIFTRINYFQKQVNKSLVYDLLEFNTDPSFKVYKEAHEIASILNYQIGSPFYGRIKMLGVGEGMLSQAAFVESLSTKYKIVELLNPYTKNIEDKAYIIDSYFDSARDSFKKVYDKDYFIFSSSVIFYSLSKVLNQILQNAANDATKLDFNRYTYAIASCGITIEKIRSFGGLSGVNALSQIFLKALEGEK